MLRPGKSGVMGWKDFGKGLKTEIKKDKVTDASGMVTFAAFLAIFPFLVFLVSLASLIIDPARAQSLIDQVSDVAPPQVTQILGEQIHKLGEGNNAGLLTFGALAAIWAASSGMVALTKALNTAYDVEERRNFFKLRGIAIGMVFVSALMVLLAGAAMIVTPLIADLLPGVLGTVLNLLRFPLAGLVMMVTVALLYWALPDVKPRPFQFMTFGAVSAVILWLIASWGFSLYVQNFGKYEASYGALGGVMVFLLWMYITANVMLVGAEMNALLEQHAKATGQVAQGEESRSTASSSGQEVPPKHVSEAKEGGEARSSGSGAKGGNPGNHGKRGPRGGYRSPAWAAGSREGARHGGPAQAPAAHRSARGGEEKPSLMKALGKIAVFGLAAKVFGRRRQVNA